MDRKMQLITAYLDGKISIEDLVESIVCLEKQLKEAETGVKIIEKEVEKVIEKPVEKVKYIEKTVPVIKEKIVYKDNPVENSETVSRNYNICTIIAVENDDLNFLLHAKFPVIPRESESIIIKNEDNNGIYRIEKVAYEIKDITSSFEILLYVRKID